MRVRQWFWRPRSHLGRSLRLTGLSASTWSTFHLGRVHSDWSGARRDPSSDGAAISLWPLQTRRIRNRLEHVTMESAHADFSHGLHDCCTIAFALKPKRFM